MNSPSWDLTSAFYDQNNPANCWSCGAPSGHMHLQRCWKVREPSTPSSPPTPNELQNTARSLEACVTNSVESLNQCGTRLSEFWRMLETMQMTSPTSGPVDTPLTASAKLKPASTVDEDMAQRRARTLAQSIQTYAKLALTPDELQHLSSLDVPNLAGLLFRLQLAERQRSSPEAFSSDLMASGSPNPKATRSFKT